MSHDEGLATVSTHVLDATTGTPAAGVPVVLLRVDDDAGRVHEATTDADGRVKDLAPGGLAAGTYRLVFDTGAWFAATGVTGFYPEVAITFAADAGRHHHVPLLLSPYAYSTYRGS